MCLGGTYPSAVLAFEVSQCVVSAAKPMICVTTPAWFLFWLLRSPCRLLFIQKARDAIHFRGPMLRQPRGLMTSNFAGARLSQHA